MSLGRLNKQKEIRFSLVCNGDFVLNLLPEKKFRKFLIY